MITLNNDVLEWSFPEVHPHARMSIDFQRTLRIPDDNRDHPLPPGLGRFPLAHVDDFAATLPAKWLMRGGVFLPLYQAEALWMNFSAGSYPFAVEIAAGMINAVSGSEWDGTLKASPQNYVVVPGQPWLDGFSIDRERVRQFVAMPLGEGYTAEEQLTNDAVFGGLQIMVFPMKSQRYEALVREREARRAAYVRRLETCEAVASVSCAMGMAPGGLMRQSIYEDEFGLDAWDRSSNSRCYVHLLNSQAYRAITGYAPPTKPPTAKDYTKAGLPWYDYYDADRRALEGSERLARLDSVGAKAVKNGYGPMPDNSSVVPKKIISLEPKLADHVRNGRW